MTVIVVIVNFYGVDLRIMDCVHGMAYTICGWWLEVKETKNIYRTKQHFSLLAISFLEPTVQ